MDGTSTGTGTGRRRRAITDADLLYARLRPFQRLVDRTLTDIEHMLSAVSDGWIVAFSGGKDSTVLLDLARRVDANLPAIFVDSGAEYPETLAFVSVTPRVTTYHPELSLLEMYRMVDQWGHVGGEYPDHHWPHGSIKRCMIEEPMRRVRRDLGTAGNLIGLRADESSRRTLLRRTRGKLFQVADGQWRGYPLFDWTTADVWGYIASRELAYNAVYDRLAELGEPREQWRVAPYAGGSAIGFGRWSALKRGWPELFNRFAAEFPEVRSYA